MRLISDASRFSVICLYRVVVAAVERDRANLGRPLLDDAQQVAEHGDAVVVRSSSHLSARSMIDSSRSVGGSFRRIVSSAATIVCRRPCASASTIWRALLVAGGSRSRSAASMPRRGRGCSGDRGRGRG